MDIVIISEFSEDLSKMDNDRFAYLLIFYQKKIPLKLSQVIFGTRKKDMGTALKIYGLFLLLILMNQGILRISV